MYSMVAFCGSPGRRLTPLRKTNENAREIHTRKMCHFILAALGTSPLGYRLITVGCGLRRLLWLQFINHDVKFIVIVVVLIFLFIQLFFVERQLFAEIFGL